MTVEEYGIGVGCMFVLVWGVVLSIYVEDALRNP